MSLSERAIVNDLKEGSGIADIYPGHASKIRRSSYSMNGQCALSSEPEVVSVHALVGNRVFFDNGQFIEALWQPVAENQP